MNYKAIIFDLDGTLIDSVGDIGAFANQALADYGYPTHTIDNYIDWIGNGARKLMERAVPNDMSADEFDKLYSDYLKIYELAEHTNSEIYEGIPELLDYLVENGTTICLLTNKPHAVMLRTMSCYFDKWPFKICLGQREGLPKKPDPTYAIEIAKEIGLAVEDVIFIGDSAVDVKTGNAAGIRTICVENGYETLENIKAAQPTYSVPVHADIIKVLQKES